MAAKNKVKRPAKARDLAQQFGVSVRTVVRVMAQPRAEFLAHSLTRTRPWDALGMSRSSWYAKGKPVPPAQS